MNESSRNAFAGNAAIYTPICSEGQTRVLAIEDESLDKSITTALHVIDLNSAIGPCLLAERQPIAYKALSYCWGEQKFDHTIICNGLLIRITASLHSALLRIRERYGRCYLWVDAICINQGNLNERASQVVAMIAIYTQAEEVIAWFGQNKTGLSLQDALRIYPLHEDNESAEKLACNPWFYRVWIRQEVWAARRLTVLYGSESCAWDELVLLPPAYRTAGANRQ